jgi:hypothetical protein
VAEIKGKGCPVTSQAGIYGRQRRSSTDLDPGARREQVDCSRSRPPYPRERDLVHNVQKVG